MKVRLLIFFLVIASVLLIAWTWWKQAIKPVDESDTSQKVMVIAPGTSVRSIADELKKEDLIRSSVAFFLYSRLYGYDNQLQAGDFRLSPSMDIPTVIENLTKGSIDIWVTIPEGWRNTQIAQKLSQDMGIPESEFLKIAQEGYMFPDTYLFPKDASAGAVSEVFMKNFRKKVTPDLLARAQEKGLSEKELITIASLVEREARYQKDRPLIASVILNRLALPMKLDIDATIQYALGYQSSEKSWWKKELTYADLEIDSPYNTYRNRELPPTPIANPGLASIQAVIDAPATSYLYYVADKQGQSHFAETLEQHNENITKYR